MVPIVRNFFIHTHVIVLNSAFYLDDTCVQRGYWDAITEFIEATFE
jgi:hypothetical protein